MITRGLVRASSTLRFAPSLACRENHRPPPVRKVNLGSMVEFIRDYVPVALTQLPDHDRLSDDITLRVAPTVHPNVPMIKGHMSYVTSLKATQLIFTTFLLHPQTQLHITDLEVDEEGKTHIYGLIPGSTKIIVKWTTCPGGCHHIKGATPATEAHQPVQAKSDGDARRFDIGGVLGTLFGSSKPLSSGETSKEIRVIFGIFVFELNHNCDKILVHNLENLDMLDKEDYNQLGNWAPST